jgi:hypothetical protein
MKMSFGDIPSRVLVDEMHVLVDELIRRVGVDEACRQVGLPVSTDLHQFTDELDRQAKP